MKIKISLLLTLLVISITSCKDSLQKALKQDATGSPYDLYLVIDNALKATELGDTLYAIFEFPMEGTPNGDPYFRVRHLEPKSFESQFIRTVANVALIDIDPQNATVPHISVKRDMYAKDQLILHMRAKNIESLTDSLSSWQAAIRQVYVKNELNRKIHRLTEEHRVSQSERLMKMQNASLFLPLEMNVDCKPAADSSFFWVTDNFAERQSWVIAYSVPYTDQNIFSLEGAVAVRDSIVKRNITGSDSTQYMETNQYVVLPEYKAININGRYTGELRGMWRMHNGMMAGPFISHFRLDELNQRVVVVEGFCYAPNSDKRLLIRNLEAALYTLKLPSDKIIPEIEITLNQ